MMVVTATILVSIDMVIQLIMRGGDIAPPSPVANSWRGDGIFVWFRLLFATVDEAKLSKLTAANESKKKIDRERMQRKRLKIVVSKA